MKKYLLYVIFLLIVLLPSDADALMCSNELKIKYTEMAKNISINYEYVEHDDDVDFTIKVSNIPEGFIVYDAVNVINYTYNGPELVLNNIKKNKTYKFGIYIDDSSCKGVILYTYYLTIPPYNKYYKDELCKGIEDYKLCSKWININMSYEDWKIKIHKYLDKLNKKEEKEVKKEEESFFKVIYSFITSYYYILIPGFIIILVLGKIIYNKKHDLF